MQSAKSFWGGRATGLSFRKSLYWRLCRVLSALLFFAGGIQLVLFFFLAKDLEQEVDQLLNWDLAAEIVERIEPLVRETIDYAALEERLYTIGVMSPRLRLYFVDETGQVRMFLRRDHNVAQAINPAPIRAFLASSPGAARPIYGDDPKANEPPKVFSAAPLRFGSTPGYLYVVLAGENYLIASRVIQINYVLKNATGILLLSIVLTLLIGLFAFATITRRLDRMIVSVERFRSGDLQARVESGTEDELGRLGAAFNQMADQLNASIESLKNTDNERRQLVANIAHDLRGPLTTVYGYLETLAIDTEMLDEAGRKKAIAVAFRNVGGLRKLVQELFELSKLDAKEIEPAKAAIDVPELFEYLKAKYQAMAEESGITLSASAGPGVRNALADAALLERCLSNLIENALRYTPREGRVDVAATAGSGRIQFQVSDSGPGIAPGELPHIFDRFYQGSASRKKGGGTGLGLAIVKKIVEAHGGAIQVESREGEGSRFFFDLTAAGPDGA